VARDVSNEVNDSARRRYGEIVQPRLPVVPEFFWLRVIAGLHFVVGSTSFVAGSLRVVWKVYQRWVLGVSSIYISGLTLARTYAIAIAGLLVLGVGAALMAMRLFLRSRYYVRPYPGHVVAPPSEEQDEE